MDVEVTLTIKKIVRISEKSDIDSAIQIALNDIKDEKIIKIEAKINNRGELSTPSKNH